MFYKNGQLYDTMSGNHLKKDHVRDKTDAMFVFLNDDFNVVYNSGKPFDVFDQIQAKDHGWRTALIIWGG